MAAGDIFEKMQPALVKAIPKLVRAANVDGPICILRIFYYDSHAPCTYLDFRTVSIVQRTEAFEKAKVKGPLRLLWAAGAGYGTRLRVSLPREPMHPQFIRALNPFHSRLDARIGGMFARVYRLMEKEDEGEGDGEAEVMNRFRTALRGVATKLNQFDWKAICDVSDDFVVVPADGSGHFREDENDVIASVPSDKIKLLQSRGFLGSDDALFEHKPG